MKCKVYYTSAKYIAEALASVIAGAVDVAEEPLNPAYMPEGIDLMFLGCDGSHDDPVVMDFIAGLMPERVRYAALFNANSRLSPRALEHMRAALEARGVRVLENTLLCMSRQFQRELTEFDRTSALDFAALSRREVSRRSGR